MGRGFWQGLQSYQKEIDEEKKYMEAFKLKQDAFELQQKQFELAEDTLDFNKLTKAREADIKLLDVLRKMNPAYGGGLGGAKNLYKTGEAPRGNNEFYAKKIIQEFKVDPKHLSRFASKTGDAFSIQNDINFRIYNELSRATKLFQEKRGTPIPKDVMGEFFNNFTETVVTPSMTLDAIRKEIPEAFETFGDEYLENLTTTLGNQTLKLFSVPSITDPRQIAGIAQEDKLKENFYNKLAVRAQEDYDYFVRVGSKGLRPENINDAQYEVFKKYAKAQEEELGIILGETKLIQRPKLFSYYGTTQLYEDVRNTRVDYDFLKEAFSPELQTEKAPRPVGISSDDLGVVSLIQTLLNSDNFKSRIFIGDKLLFSNNVIGTLVSEDGVTKVILDE